MVASGAVCSQYDYGARFYDPVIGRMTTIDPMAENDGRYSTYSYFASNPIRFIVVDGMVPDEYFTRGGEYLGIDDSETDNVRVIDKDTYNSITSTQPHSSADGGDDDIN